MNLTVFCYLFTLLGVISVFAEDNAVAASVKVEGQIVEPENMTMDFNFWLRDVSIELDGGIYVTYPRIDGYFEFPSVLPGSYVIHVVNPTQAFEKVRIDITSSGKVRARSWNILKPTEVKVLPYPPKLKSEGAYRFFQPREQWRITDFLFNPMVLMMVIPVLFIFIMPKMNQDDPEVRQQMQQMMNPGQNMPDISSALTKILGGTENNQQQGRRGAAASGASRRSGSNKRN